MGSMSAGHEDAARARRRRRFATLFAPVALALIVAGGMFADESDVLGAVGLAAVAQGTGLGVALVWLAAGHNPLSKR